MNPTHEVSFVHGKHASLTPGSNRGRADIPVKNGHLAKELSRPVNVQLYFFSPAIDDYFDFPFLNDEHAIALISLTDDYLAILVYFS